MRNLDTTEWFTYKFFTLEDKISYFSSLSCSRKLMCDEAIETIEKMNQLIIDFKSIPVEEFLELYNTKQINTFIFTASSFKTTIYLVPEIYKDLHTGMITELTIRENYQALMQDIINSCLDDNKGLIFKKTCAYYEKNKLLGQYKSLLDVMLSNPRISRKCTAIIMKSSFIKEDSIIRQSMVSNKKGLFHTYNGLILQAAENNLDRIFALYPKRIEFKKNRFLTGNSIYCFLSKHQINDYDFFVNDKRIILDVLNYIYSQNTVALQNLQVKDGEVEYKDVNNGIEIMINNPSSTIIAGIMIDKSYHHVVITRNAITFTNTQVQLIFRTIGTIKEVTSTFDFEHCKVALDFNRKEAHSSFITDFAIKQNMVMLSRKLTNPIGALVRLQKFTTKYKMRATENDYIALGFALMEYKIDPTRMAQDISFYGKNEIEEYFKTKDITYETLTRYLYSKAIAKANNTYDIKQTNEQKIKNKASLIAVHSHF